MLKYFLSYLQIILKYPHFVLASCGWNNVSAAIVTKTIKTFLKLTAFFHIRISYLEIAIISFTGFMPTNLAVKTIN